MKCNRCDTDYDAKAYDWHKAHPDLCVERLVVQRDDANKNLEISRGGVEDLFEQNRRLRERLAESCKREERYRAALQAIRASVMSATTPHTVDAGVRLVASDALNDDVELQPGEARMGTPCDRGCGRLVDHFIAGILQPTCIACHVAINKMWVLCRHDVLKRNCPLCRVGENP